MLTYGRMSRMALSWVAYGIETGLLDKDEYPTLGDWLACGVATVFASAETSDEKTPSNLGFENIALNAGILLYLYACQAPECPPADRWTSSFDEEFRSWGPQMQITCLRGAAAPTIETSPGQRP